MHKLQKMVCPGSRCHYTLLTWLWAKKRVVLAWHSYISPSTSLKTWGPKWLLWPLWNKWTWKAIGKNGTRCRPWWGSSCAWTNQRKLPTHVCKHAPNEPKKDADATKWSAWGNCLYGHVNLTLRSILSPKTVEYWFSWWKELRNEPKAWLRIHFGPILLWFGCSRTCAFWDL